MKRTCKRCKRPFEFVKTKRNQYVKKTCSKFCAHGVSGSKSKGSKKPWKNKKKKAFPRCEGCNKTSARHGNRKWNRCFKCLQSYSPHLKLLSKALKGKCGGYRVNSGNRRFKGGYYKGVWMDSTWERLLAIDLDKNNIKWIRPKPLEWKDKNKTIHKYHPDFYLPNFNVYLDPKNDHLIEQSIDKIRRIRRQRKIKLLILRKPDLNWNAVRLKLDL